MPSRTALITGVLGQDGSLLAELLIARGYLVVGVARPGSTLPLEGPLAGVKFVEVDLLDPEGVRLMLERWQPDELYHLAAFHHSSEEPSISAALGGKGEMLVNNFLTTKTLAFELVALQSPCHFVFASSSQIFSATEMEQRIDERSQRQPATFYGHTKSWSMELLSFLRDESDLRVSSAILFNHESERRGPQFVSRKITLAAASAAAGERPQLRLRNVQAKADWSSARDVVDALGRMGRAELPGDYVVASGTLRTVRDFARLAFELVGLDWKDFVAFDRDVPAPAVVGDPGKFRFTHGWTGEIRFEELVGSMVAHDQAKLAKTSSSPDSGGT